ncbi:hypothetical protein D3C76_963230 [compost metagenome]
MVSRLKAYANEQYNKGWDVIVECWDKAEYVEAIDTVTTKANRLNEDALFKAAKADIQVYVGLHEEQRSDTRFE